MICSKCNKFCNFYKVLEFRTKTSINEDLNLDKNSDLDGRFQFSISVICQKCSDAEEINIRTKCFEVLNAPTITDSGEIK